MSGYWAGIMAILCFNIVVAYSVFLPAASGQLNLGAAGFVAIGAYSSGYISTDLGAPMLVSILLGALVTGFVAFVISFPILRTRGVYMVLATFAFAEVVQGVFINLEVFGAAAGYPVAAFADLDVIVPLTIGVVVFVFFLMTTRLGLSMRAVHDDEPVAALFGVNARFTQVTAFTLGGIVAGIGGAIWAHNFNYVEIQNFNILLSIFVLLYVLIGGTQTAFGPLIGAVFFTLMPEALRVSEEWRFVFFGILIILMMVVRPEGLVTRTMLDRIKGLFFRRKPAPVVES
ncbi:MAG: branched-chain amino acid ABC transporter permease [Alphaproteobacteria bacterium]